jgi:hypothetical protein
MILTPYSHQQIGQPDKKINKEKSELNDAIDKMKLRDIKKYSSNSTEFTFLSASHATFSKIGYETSLKKSRKLKLQSVFYQITME